MAKAKIEKLRLKSRRPYPSQFDMLNTRLAKIEQDIGVLRVTMDEIIMRDILGNKMYDKVKELENGKSP